MRPGTGSREKKPADATTAAAAFPVSFPGSSAPASSTSRFGAHQGPSHDRGARGFRRLTSVCNRHCPWRRVRRAVGCRRLEQMSAPADVLNTDERIRKRGVVELAVFLRKLPGRTWDTLRRSANPTVASTNVFQRPDPPGTVDYLSPGCHLVLPRRINRTRPCEMLAGWYSTPSITTIFLCPVIM